MKKLTLLVLATLLFISCEQRTNCEQTLKYLNRFGIAHRELSKNNPVDSAYMNYVEFARTFVTDSLEQDVRCFQYNLDVDVHNNQVLAVVKLYDKRLEIAEKSSFNDSIHYRLNNLRNLYFDSTGVYLYNIWVPDTEEEMEESDRMLNEYFKGESGS